MTGAWPRASWAPDARAGLLAVAMLLLAPAPLRLETVNRIVATIDGEPVTLVELENFTDQTRQRPSGSDPPTADQRTMLDELVLEKIVKKQIEAQGVTASEQQIDSYIASIRERNELSDAQLKAGDGREALRTWERALEAQPALPLLGRIEQLHRAEGRPTRMISLYKEAAARHPDNLAVAFGLGRVYFELAMLDEAAEQFEKMEVRAQELPSIHAYLGAIFERRGQLREALEEYRRALRFTESFDWPHRCVSCGAAHPRWVDRCPSCRCWNTSRP